MLEIDWNTENTWIVCKLFAEQVEKGNQPSTYLNALCYSEVEKGFKDRTCLEISKGQLKNKWDKLKEDYKVWKKLLMKETGIGWNPAKRTFTMDDEWWKKARTVSVSWYCFYLFLFFFVLICACLCRLS